MIISLRLYRKLSWVCRFSLGYPHSKNILEIGGFLGDIFTMLLLNLVFFVCYGENKLRDDRNLPSDNGQDWARPLAVE